MLRDTTLPEYKDSPSILLAEQQNKLLIIITNQQGVYIEKSEYGRIEDVHFKPRYVILAVDIAKIIITMRILSV